MANERPRTYTYMSTCANRRKPWEHTCMQGNTHRTVSTHHWMAARDTLAESGARKSQHAKRR